MVIIIPIRHFLKAPTSKIMLPKSKSPFLHNSVATLLTCWNNHCLFSNKGSLREKCTKWLTNETYLIVFNLVTAQYIYYWLNDSLVSNKRKRYMTNVYNSRVISGRSVNHPLYLNKYRIFVWIKYTKVLYKDCFMFLKSCISAYSICMNFACIANN